MNGIIDSGTMGITIDSILDGIMDGSTGSNTRMDTKKGEPYHVSLTVQPRTVSRPPGRNRLA
jgi:hypothetical protein